MPFVSQKAFIFKSVTAARHCGGHTYLLFLILDGRCDNNYSFGDTCGGHTKMILGGRRRAAPPNHLYLTP